MLKGVGILSYFVGEFLNKFNVINRGLRLLPVVISFVGDMMTAETICHQLMSISKKKTKFTKGHIVGKISHNII